MVEDVDAVVVGQEQVGLEGDDDVEELKVDRHPS